MTIQEQVRTVRAKITEAEAALAAADAVASQELRDMIEPADLARVETALARAIKATNALHRAAGKAKARDGVVMPKIGK